MAFWKFWGYGQMQGQPQSTLLLYLTPCAAGCGDPERAILLDQQQRVILRS
jgi:hypothetical protein